MVYHVGDRVIITVSQNTLDGQSANGIPGEEYRVFTEYKGSSGRNEADSTYRLQHITSGQICNWHRAKYFEHVKPCIGGE